MTPSIRVFPLTSDEPEVRSNALGDLFQSSHVHTVLKTDIAIHTRVSELLKQSPKEKYLPCKQIVVPRQRRTHKHRPSQPYKACIGLANLIMINRVTQMS